MAKKKRIAAGGGKPHGHFCKVCGEHKANERFSGKGHAAHICKTCADLPAAERNERMTIRKIEGMAFRHLSESEMKWLRDHMSDPRTAVREAATEANRVKFPRYERNVVKKGMSVFSLELFIHDMIYDRWGDTVDVHARVIAEDTGDFRYTDYNMPEGERERTAHVDKKEARRFLKAVVHELDAPFWDEDFSDTEYEHDPYLDTPPEYRPDFEGDDEHEDGEDEEPAQDIAPGDEREPLWSLRLELNTGEDKEMVFFNHMRDAPVDLFWLLMEYFDPEDEDADIAEE